MAATKQKENRLTDWVDYTVRLACPVSVAVMRDAIAPFVRLAIVLQPLWKTEMNNCANLAEDRGLRKNTESTVRLTLDSHKLLFAMISPHPTNLW